MTTMLSDARRGHPGLFWFAAAMAALTLVTIGLAAVDHRTLLGVPLWFKPMKFAISLTLYALALAWMLGQLRERAMRRTGWFIVAGVTLEMVVIVGQAAHGVRSHFNDDTPFDIVLFALMGATITLVWLRRWPSRSGSSASRVATARWRSPSASACSSPWSGWRSAS